MKLYKITDRRMTVGGRTIYFTRNDMQWGEGVTHWARGMRGQGLCSSEFIHAYAHKCLAVFLMRNHTYYDNPHLFAATGEIEASDGVKVGCRKLTTDKLIPFPKVTKEQCIRFAIGCAALVSSPEWSRKALRALRLGKSSLAAPDLSSGNAYTARMIVCNNIRYLAPAYEYHLSAFTYAAGRAAEEVECALSREALQADFARIAEWAMSDSQTPPKPMAVLT